MSQRVDLVALDVECGHEWVLGERWSVPATPAAVAEWCLRQLPAVDESAWWLFWDPRLGDPPRDAVAAVVNTNVDVAHAGLRLGLGGQPSLIDTVSPTWPLNRDLDSDRAGMSWRASLRACLVRAALVRALGPPRAVFSSLAGASLEWGHRLVQNGAVVVHRPELVSAPGLVGDLQLAIPLDDQLRFIRHRYGRRWLRWAMLRTVLAGEVSLAKVVAAARRIRREAVPSDSPPLSRSGAGSSDAAASSRAVTVLLPTIERYPSLRTLLGQLEVQTVPPAQVVIIDQTPVEQRDGALARDFPNLPIELVYLEQAGQCSARNAGLARATGDCVLFLDDDDEVEPNLIERHLGRLEATGFAASCGVADEVGAGPLPDHFERHRLSDVFPTNNTLLRIDALRGSGLFDLAYDHGPRADGDLGMRLYLSGALLWLSPDIRVLHNHAPRGGLRTHGARSVTYAASRQRVLVRHLPAVTELYLARRYFTPRQRREAKWIRVIGTLSMRGGRGLRVLKAGVGLLQLPWTVRTIARRDRAARAMLESGGYPRIPTFEDERS